MITSTTPPIALKRRKLPIGIQTFRQIREDNFYYVDKSGLILDLIDTGKYYFLSRPRRFGKSLLIDTIKELFEGSQDLFTGLIAETRWDWSKKYPVIRISFGGGVLHSREALNAKISDQLDINQDIMGLCTKQLVLSLRFGELIRLANTKYGQRVVVLVDEYDKPILDNITESSKEIAREMRDGLRNFYSVIKDSDEHIRFAMLTGVSKFSRVSLFSGLNNLHDITVSAAYSSLCGYTDEDVNTIFAPELPGLDRNKIREWYNGYNWTGTSVYNPFDLLLLFEERRFLAHWFETGTPNFLIDLLTTRNTWIPELGQLVSDAQLLSTFDVDNISTEALMFQAGYLTIDELIEMDDAYYFRLRYPNREVRQSLHASLLVAWTPNSTASIANRVSLHHFFKENNFAGMKELFTTMYNCIPFEWFTNNPIAQYEGYYASVFYSYFAALGVDITPEKSSNAGRLDMAVRYNHQVYLFEFKVVELSPDGRALQQIKDKGYAKPYLALGQPIHQIGVEFSKTSRTVVGFEVETITGS